MIESAHDLSEGGLAVNIAESVIASNEDIGASINVARKLTDIELLFGECPSVIIVTVNQSNLYNLVKIAKSHDIHTQTIGTVTNDSRLSINDNISISKNKLKGVYLDSLSNIMNQ